MKKPYSHFLTIIIAMLLATNIFAQTNYYVATDGNDASGDGTSGNPWLTIKKAVDIAGNLNPTTESYIINVEAGTYTLTQSISVGRDFAGLTIVGDGAGSTIIDANNACRVIYLDNDDALTLKLLTIKNGLNSAGQSGGGIYSFGHLVIEDCTISDNTSIGAGTLNGGGAIYSRSYLSMKRCTISNNTSAKEGGGIFAQSGSYTTRIVNCTFSNNSADSRGGGIFFNQCETAILTNVTIANNISIGAGGGVFTYMNSDDYFWIKNTIIANNSGSTTDDFNHEGSGSIANNGYNIVEIQSGSNFSDGVNNCHVGAGTYNISEALATNSSTNGTKTLATTSGSDAIDGGNSATAGQNEPPSTDQRGVARNGDTDIGAYEYDGVVPVELTSLTATPINAVVVLNWTTATEVNNYGFEVLKTLSGAEAWETIGFVDGHGNSNSPKDYSFIDQSVAERSRSYRLKQIDFDGAFEYSDVVTVEMELSKDFKLVQNYPNPFNPTTSIAFTLPTKGFVTLKVYNTIGEEVAELLNKNIEAGNHNVIFSASNLPTGAYFYRITADNFSETKKMLLIK